VQPNWCLKGTLLSRILISANTQRIADSEIDRGPIFGHKMENVKEYFGGMKATEEGIFGHGLRGIG
jgi:hypothetical protein